jgi:hypothetical protein
MMSYCLAKVRWRNGRQAYKDILEIFSSATSMAISENKSTFLEFGLEVDIIAQIKVLFPFEVKVVDNGFKYLEFF